MSKQAETISIKSLKAGRQKIDLLDTELLRLLNRRARIAIKLGAIKIACGLPAYDGGRERQVMTRMRSRNQGPFAGESVARIFGCIIRETRKVGTEYMRRLGGKRPLSSEHRERASRSLHVNKEGKNLAIRTSEKRVGIPPLRQAQGRNAKQENHNGHQHGSRRV